MRAGIILRNRQRARAVNLRRLRAVVLCVVEQLFERPPFELGIYLVSASEITGLNEAFLRHRGATDVIAFDYGSSGISAEPGLHGEIFVCLEEAVVQARRFRTTWPSELIRYIVHGLLHLQGYDDRRAADRRRMKQKENRLLRGLARQFDFRQFLTR